MSEVRLNVRVVPKASRNNIVLGDGAVLRVYVTAPPTDGEANAAVIELLAKALKIGKSAITIVSGVTSRQKTLSISGLDEATVWARLRQDR